LFFKPFCFFRKIKFARFTYSAIGSELIFNLIFHKNVDNLENKEKKESQLQNYFLE
jgi:hypothetical protein